MVGDDVSVVSGAPDVKEVVDGEEAAAGGGVMRARAVAEATAADGRRLK